MKKVAFIAGTAFCGSSLLNILLDTQGPAIRGLGERSQTEGEAGGPCVLCKKPVKICRLYSRWNGRDFYEFNFNHYGCSTLVDSSKRTNMLLQGMAREPQFMYYVLHMSKTPHAAAHSIMKHWQYDHWDRPLTDSKRDITKAFQAWISTNQLYLDEVCQGEAAGVKHVHYDTLAGNPATVIEEICQWLGEHSAQNGSKNGDRQRRISWAETRQYSCKCIAKRPPRPKALLRGKIHKKGGKIFVDEAWKHDWAFLTSAIETYDRLSGILDPVLTALGYCNSAQMANECQQALSESLTGIKSNLGRGMLLRTWDFLTSGKAA